MVLTQLTICMYVGGSIYSPLCLSVHPVPCLANNLKTPIGI